MDIIDIICVILLIVLFLFWLALSGLNWLILKRRKMPDWDEARYQEGEALGRVIGTFLIVIFTVGSIVVLLFLL